MTTQSVHAIRRERATRGARLFGYSLSMCVQATLLWLVNVEPGWPAVPFLTDDAGRVMSLFNASLVVGLVINSLWLLYDPPRVRRLGDAVNAAVSLAFLARLLDIFPFEFSAPVWTTTARVALILSIVGTAVAVVVNLVQAVRPLPLSRD